MKTCVKKLFDECMNRYPLLQSCSNDIMSAYDLLFNCYSQNGKVLVCGNGGSAADTEHIIGELMNKFRIRRPADLQTREKLLKSGLDESLIEKLERALPAISLVSQSALITAIVNDMVGELIYAQQVFGYGKPGDVLIAISTSGNSGNILNAVKVAKALNVKTIGFSCSSGGKMKSVCDVMICVPNQITFQIQELHLPVYHLLCAMLEEEFFGTEP